MTVLTQPLYYWAIYLLLALAVVIAFWFFNWSISTGTRRLSRRIDVVGIPADEQLTKLYWTHLRHIEFFNAKLITFNRSRLAHPERFAALVSEGVPLNEVIEAMAS